MAVSGASASGGSSGADSIRAGKAFVELTTKDDSLRAGLNAARQKVMDLQRQLAHPMLKPALTEFSKLGLQADILNKKLALEQARAKLANPMLRPMLAEMAKLDKEATKVQKKLAFEELVGKVGPIRAYAKAIGDSFKNVGSMTAKIGGGIGAVGGLAFAPLAAAFHGALSRGSKVSELATKLGVGTEQLSEFAYAAETTGQSFQDLEGHFENLAERVDRGAEGAGEAADTFKKLGIDAAQLKLKNPVEQLIALADAMQNVKNETQRLGMLSSLGGDKFQGLNALFKSGPEGIAKLMQEAKDVGASVSAESAAQAVKTEQAFNRAWASIKGVVYTVGEAFLPLVEYLAEGVKTLVQFTGGIRAFIQNNRILVQVIGGVSAGIVAVGIGIVALGGIIMAVGSVITAFGTIASVALAPITLKILLIAAAVAAVVAVVGILTYAFLKFTSLGQMLTGSLGATFSEMWGTAKVALGGIGDALKAGNLQLAWDIACKGLRIIWNDLIIGLKTLWNDYLKWYFTKTVDSVKNVAKAFGLESLASKITGGEEEAKKKFLDTLGFDLTADIAQRDKLKKELDALVDKSKPALPAVKGEKRSFTEYLPRVTDHIKGLYNAPNLNQALGYGDELKVNGAILETAKNTGKTVEAIGRLNNATFR